MNKQAQTVLSIASLLAMLAVVSVHADSDSEVRADIPFDFMVGKTAYPTAGEFVGPTRSLFGNGFPKGPELGHFLLLPPLSWEVPFRFASQLLPGGPPSQGGRPPAASQATLPRSKTPLTS